MAGFVGPDDELVEPVGFIGPDDETVRTAAEDGPSGTAAGGATQFFAGFNRQLGNIVQAVEPAVHLPGTLFDQAVGMATGRPVARRERPKNPLIQLADEAPPAQGGVERVAGRMGEEFANALTVAGPIYGAAVSGVRAGAGALGNLANRILTSIRAAPARSAAGDVVTTASSGAGAGLAQEVAPGSETAETTGQVVGGLAPVAVTHGPAAGAVSAGRYLWGRYASRSAREAMAREAAARVVGGELAPAAREGIEHAEQLRQDMPGFNPTLAEQTGLPSMTATQRRLEGQAQGRDLEAFAARREGSEQAVEQYARASAPEGQADGGPEFVFDTASGRIERLTAGIERGRARVAEARAENAARAPEGRPAAAGETLRLAYTQMRAEARDRMKRLADDLGISDSDVSVPFARWRDQLAKDLEPESAFARQPQDLPYLSRILGDIEEAGGEGAKLAFKDVKALRERLTDDITTAMRGSYAGQRKDLEQLLLVRKRVDDLINDLAETGSPSDPTLATRYKQFRDAYRTDYIERFEKGAAFKVHERDARGFYRNEDEQIAATFWSPGKVSALRQFNRVFGNDADANQALVDVALDSLHRATVRGGQIEPKLFATWRRGHADLLDERPDIAKLVGNIAETEAALVSRAAQIEDRARAVQDSTLARLVSRVERGSATPEQAIDAALGDPRKMLNLTAGIRANPDARAALSRHVWDRAAFQDAGPMLEFIAKYRPSLVTALGETHVRHLEKIQVARAMHERLPAPTGQAFDPNPLRDIEGATGMNVSQLASRYVNVASGRLSARVAGADAFGRFWRNLRGKQSADLLKEANYNPQVARDLAELASAPMERAPGLVERLTDYMARAGRPIAQLGARVALDSDER